MSNLIKSTLIFMFGAAFGGLVAWRVLDRAYAQVSSEEDEEDEFQLIRAETRASILEDLKNHIGAPPVDEKETYISEASAYNIPNMDEIDKERVEAKRYDWPYIIKPEEFGDLEYELISLTLYADNVLVDDAGDLIEDPDDIVGLENLDRIGEYEDDAIHVRNDTLMCDYEILMDRRNYSDIKEE